MRASYISKRCSGGRGEVPGITLMPSEAEAFWAVFLRSLTTRACVA